MNAARLALAAAIAAALGGCSEPLPISVKLGDGRGALDELPAEVEDACEIVGLECAADPGGTWGTWVVDLVEVAESKAPTVHGTTHVRRACEPITWVSPDADLIAHELGHALGLEHSDDEHGLMYAVDPGLDLSEAEQRSIERGGNRLVGCRL